MHVYKHIYICASDVFVHIHRERETKRVQLSNYIHIRIHFHASPPPRASVLYFGKESISKSPFEVGCRTRIRRYQMYIPERALIPCLCEHALCAN